MPNETVSSVKEVVLKYHISGRYLAVDRYSNNDYWNNQTRVYAISKVDGSIENTTSDIVAKGEVIEIGVGDIVILKWGYDIIGVFLVEWNGTLSALMTISPREGSTSYDFKLRHVEHMEQVLA